MGIFTFLVKVLFFGLLSSYFCREMNRKILYTIICTIIALFPSCNTNNTNDTAKKPNEDLVNEQITPKQKDTNTQNSNNTKNKPNNANNDGTAKTITFSEHIAPIIHQNCTPCHRPGESGPFPLRTYEEVAKHARMIQYVTSIGFMPPWPADPNYSQFAGERFLTENQKELIKEWVRAGWPIGDSTQIPSIPEYPKGSQLGKPDLVLQIPEKYKLKGNSEDAFLTMKIPYEIPQDTFVRLIEFVPDNRQLVHHVNSHLIFFDKKQQINEDNWVVDAYKFGKRKPLYEYLGILNDDDSYPELIPLVSNYLPGVVSQFYPEDIGGWPMKKKGAIVLNDIHYGPTPIDATDQSYFNIFFAPKPPKRPTMELQMGTLGISDIVPPLVIPPDTIMTFKTRAKVFRDVSLLTVNPHMHLLGKSFLAYAITPKQDTIPLISIPEWDFRWQYFYTFKKMLKLPQGSVIEVEGVYDNTADNPNNPYDPPRTIAERDGSMRTTDEMLQFIMTFVAYEEGDENISLE